MMSDSVLQRPQVSRAILFRRDRAAEVVVGTVAVGVNPFRLFLPIRKHRLGGIVHNHELFKNPK